MAARIIQFFRRSQAPLGNNGKWLRTGEQASIDCLTYALALGFYGMGEVEGRMAWSEAKWESWRSFLRSAGGGGSRGGWRYPPPYRAGFGSWFCSGGVIVSGEVVEFRVLGRYPSLLIFRDGRVLLRGSLRAPAMKEIKPERKGGYWQVSVRNVLTGRKDNPYVTRLVVEAFCFPPAGFARGDCEVHHIDSNPHNNAACNLEYLPVAAHRRADADLRRLFALRGLALGDLAEQARAAGAEVGEGLAFGGLGILAAAEAWSRLEAEFGAARRAWEWEYRARPAGELRAFLEGREKKNMKKA